MNTSPITTFPWKRFWVSRTGNIKLDDSGYLIDPETEEGRILNPDVRLFSDITSIPCLALLGEPGIGKSFALLTSMALISKNETDLVDWVDLRSYGEESRLVKRIFESEKFLRWKEGNQYLHLFIDSFDECLLRIDTLAALLPEELQKYPLERIRVRLASRTAVWPSLLEDELKKLWTDDNFGAYELCPLRRCDVSQAAEISGIDPEAFLETVARAEAVPFAIKPVTLKMLINLYKKNGQLPQKKWDLYENGCQLLLEENNESRKGAARTGNLDPEGRMAVSSRIAAVTMLANRFAVWGKPDQGDVPSEDVTIAELIGGEESAGFDRFRIGHGEIRESLDTGLFTSRGESQLGWAHQTYSEFLAARFLSQDHFSLQQILSLIRHPIGKIIPQLHELSAWLATKRDDVFDEIFSSDPEVLLLSDVANTDEASRFKLTESLLSAFESLRIRDDFFKFASHFHKLKHPRLAEQLRPYLRDRTMSLVVRRAAFMIARECSENALSHDLLGIALDSTEDEHVRSLAIMALGRCGSEQEIISLKPILFQSGLNDPEDEIKGNTLKILWPEYLTAPDLFGVLKAPKRLNSIGTYHNFLRHEVAQHLRSEDINGALTWVLKLESGSSSPLLSIDHVRNTLADKIVLKSLQFLYDPTFLRSLGKVLLQRWRIHHRFTDNKDEKSFYLSLKSEPKKKYELIKVLVGELQDPKETFLIALYSNLVTKEEVPWIVEQVLRHEKSDENLVKKFSAILRFFPIDFIDTRHFESIFEASRFSELIAEQFSWLLNPIAFESDEAQSLKRNYELSQVRPQASESDQIPTVEKILTCLDEIEKGAPEGWWHLNYWMLNSKDYLEFESDLTSFSGWLEADNMLRSRIDRAAETYLRIGSPDNDLWLGTNKLHRPALAGYRAFRLLLGENPSSVENLEDEVWSVWAASLMGYPDSSEELPIRQVLIARAYEHAPEEVLAVLKILTEREIVRGNPFNIHISKIESCPSDARLSTFLLEWLHDPSLPPELMGTIFSDLLTRQIPQVKDFAESLLMAPLSAESTQRKKALVIAREILMVGEDEHLFDVIWAVIERNESFGQELFQELGRQDPYSLLSGKFISKLGEQKLGGIYLWLDRHFPFETGPDHRDSISYLRNGILQILQKRGTKKAVEVLQMIRQTLPEHEWLFRVVLDAQNEMMRKTWLPPLPDEILKLSFDSAKRLVTNPEQLLDVLNESLQRLQNEDLHGETGRARFLWNEISKDLYRPKVEADLSDYIKKFLETDLKNRQVIVNREVEIYRPNSAGRGFSPDIHVDVIVPIASGHQRIKSVLEVKGCWNDDLKSSMNDQLVSRYLQEPDCRHGIYLVVWFNKDRWDSQDYRKDQVPKWTISKAQLFFEDQAKELSSNECQVRSFVLDAGWL